MIGCCSVILTALTLHHFNIVSFCQSQLLLVRHHNDWAKLSKYAASNSKLSQLPAGSNQVVFMGDSITEGMDFEIYFPNKQYINRGISGQTTQQMLIRFRYDVINLHPKVVILLGGVNDLAQLEDQDSVEFIVGNIKSMAELAQAHNIKVILTSILPVCGFYLTERHPSKILEINAIIADYALQAGIIFLDYFSALVGDDGFLKPEFTNDCLHITHAGYSIMAPLVENAIQNTLHSQQNIISL